MKRIRQQRCDVSPAANKADPSRGFVVSQIVNEALYDAPRSPVSTLKALMVLLLM